MPTSLKCVLLEKYFLSIKSAINGIGYRENIILQVGEEEVLWRSDSRVEL